MVAKRILYGQAGSARLLWGVNVLARAVRSTLGPGGRNVLLDRTFQSAPQVTKDGATVAEEIEVRDTFANMGVSIVKEVANQTAYSAGDGTTTATVLADAIYREGEKMVAAGHAPIELKRGIELAVERIVESLQQLSTPIRGKKDIAHVATVSANGDRSIGKTIADCMDKVGPTGIITVEDGPTLETTFEVAQGTVVDKGSLSPYFITDDGRQVTELDDPYILIHEKGISRAEDLVPIMEQVANAGRSLLVIGEVTGEALAVLVVNKMQGKLKSCAIKPPSFGQRRKDLLKDLAAQTGGRAFTDDLGFGLDQVTLDDLGSAKRIIVDKEKATIIGGASRMDEVEGRARQIKAAYEATNSTFDHKQLEERMAKLVGGAAVIRVGGATQAEIREKSARVDDAVYATRAAVEEGIVPGGGVALLRALSALPKLEGLSIAEASGVDIVRRACEEPCRQIARNAGKEDSVILSRIRKGTGAFGYNAATDKFEDLLEAGVIDPTKVVRSALTNAASIATLLIMCEAFVVDAPRTPIDFPTSGGTARDALGIEPFLSRR